MNQQITLMAARIKDLREFSDYSTEEFAALAGISLDDYIDIESGECDIPIGSLYNIAAALKIDPTVLLTGENSTKTDAQVVYKGQGTKIVRYDGYEFESLAAKFIDRQMEPMIVNLKQSVEPELVKHTGQEFNYVLEGSLRILVGDKEYYLRAGDSIYFNPTLPHAQIAMNGDSRFLTVILEK